MKLKSKFLIAALASIMLSGCASTTKYKDIAIDTETDPQADFTGYQTYAWGAAAAIIRDPNNEWAPTDLDIGAEIRYITDRELRQKGLSQVVNNPDLFAIYAVGVDMKALNVVVDEENVMRFQDAHKGGVMIILADSKTLEVVWAGSAEAELLEVPDMDLGKKRLDYAISAMFDEYPD